MVFMCSKDIMIISFKESLFLNKLVIARGQGVWGLGEKSEGNEKYKLVVTE